MTNCNHKYELMSTCRHDVDMFTCGSIVLSLLKSAHVNWNWTISREKSKNRLVSKHAVPLAYFGSCGLLVMGSWYSKISTDSGLLKIHLKADLAERN